MARNEAVRSAEEVEEDERMRSRMAVIREFIETNSRKPAKAGKN
jgi:RNA polymerase primary sigma factor